MTPSSPSSGDSQKRPGGLLRILGGLDRGLGVIERIIVGGSILVMAALMFYFAYKSIDYVMVLKDRGRVSASLRIPMWTVYLALPIGFTLAGIQYFLTIARNLMSDDIYRSFTEKETYSEVPTDDGEQTPDRDDSRGV